MQECRICSAEVEKQTIRADHVFGGQEEHKFWQCDNCEAIYLYPIPTEEEEAKFYRSEFEGFMSSRSGSDRDWSNAEAHIRSNHDQVKRRWLFLSQYLLPGMDLLEIGSSSGFMLDSFREHGLNCTGIEPSGEFIEFLKRKGYEAYERLDEAQEKFAETASEKRRKTDAAIFTFRPLH